MSANNRKNRNAGAVLNAEPSANGAEINRLTAELNPAPAPAPAPDANGYSPDGTGANLSAENDSRPAPAATEQGTDEQTDGKRERRGGFTAIPADVATALTEQGFSPVPGAGGYYKPFPNGGGFLRVEQVRRGGKFHLSYYSQTDGQPFPVRTFSTVLDPTFYV